MTRPIFIGVICILSMRSMAQEERQFSGWLSAGLGVSSFGFTEGSHWGFSANFGGAVRYGHVTLKYKRSVLDQFALGYQEHLYSHELLLGYSFDLGGGSTDELKGKPATARLGFHAGVGKAEYRSGVPIISPKPFVDAREPVTRTTTTIPIEVALERDVFPYLGGSVIAFLSISKLQPLFGMNLGLRVGLL